MTFSLRISIFFFLLAWFGLVKPSKTACFELSEVRPWNGSNIWTLLKQQNLHCCTQGVVWLEMGTRALLGTRDVYLWSFTPKIVYFVFASKPEVWLHWNKAAPNFDCLASQKTRRPSKLVTAIIPFWCWLRVDKKSFMWIIFISAKGGSDKVDKILV